ncbi:MAG: hypothetical protein JRF51_03510 [Deltaproteobacteria bacterium]|nr:hypothetical protein [Deltaproteobacteria bacterium]HDZ89833.1 hypothetical protein [Deltaproteobacteria bacterium]
MVSQTIGRIEELLGETVALQQDAVSRMCPGCQSPCCSRVHYLFNEKDILFLKLSGRKSRWRREAFTRKGCWFLDENGCVLEPGSRPFICHTYMCEDLKTAFKRWDPGLMGLLEGKFKEIGGMRSRLWAEYLEEKPRVPEP